MPRSARSPKSAGQTQAVPPPSPAPRARSDHSRSGVSRSPGVGPCSTEAGWLVYILRCRDGSLYTGITNDLARRLKAHDSGKASRYTRTRLPVTLAYREQQPTRSRALKREAAVKKLSRSQKEVLVGQPGSVKSGRR